MGMDGYKRLLDFNERWVAERTGERSDYFARLKDNQDPEYVWIGCSDSRVPAETVTGCQPGELFVHRNVANQVVHTDLNMLTVIFYAVQALRVRHIIVCGHYGCGGVRAAMEGAVLGLADNWLQHIREVQEAHQEEIDRIPTPEGRFRRLCELNVLEQVRSVSRTTVVRKAWRLDRELTVHGWIYGIEDGLIHDLHLKASSAAESTAMKNLDKARFRSRPD